MWHLETVNCIDLKLWNSRKSHQEVFRLLSDQERETDRIRAAGVSSTALAGIRISTAVSIHWLLVSNRIDIFIQISF